MANISREEYEKRFKQRLSMDSPVNAVGYGADAPYIPPLNKPQYGQTIFYKNLMLLLSGGPFGTGLSFLTSMLRSYKTGDFWDGAYYNSEMAVGSQIYPSGLSLFYDLHSFDGYTGYLRDWASFFAWLVISPVLLFVPLEVWEMLFAGTSDWLYVGSLYNIVTMPFILAYCYLWPCPLEQGWNMFGL